MGKIVITGASGQYGRGVTDRLIAAGLGIGWC
jgi:NAD(P)H dehydrogenase (quinone)